MRHVNFQGTLDMLRQRLGLDSAVVFALSGRIWQLLAATVTIVLVNRYFTPEVQGYYYTIVSLLAMQSFVDLGLGNILLLLASHEWSQLRLENGTVQGEVIAREKLAEIHQFGHKWYLGCAVVFCLLVTPIGMLVMAKTIDVGKLTNQAWCWPWILCTLVNSVSLVFAPKLSIIEGCNQVKAVNRMRFFQSVIGSMAVWVCIASGIGLWTLVVSNLVRLAWEMQFVLIEFRRMLSSLTTAHTKKRLHWRSEIWPLQWRLAVQSVSAYFATWFIVPVTFWFQGEVRAGQIGLSWQLLTTIQSASLSWVQTRLPKYGGLVAAKNFTQLDHQMTHSALISMVVYTLAVGGFLGLLGMFNLAGLRISHRFLEIAPLIWFAVGFLGSNLCLILHCYVRLFKRDPFLWVNIVANILLASTIWYTGRQFGPLAQSLGYAAVIWFYALPVAILILRSHRRRLNSGKLTNQWVCPEPQ